MSDDTIQTMHLRSAHFSGPGRIEEFRETYGRELMRLEIEPLPGHPLEIDFTVQAFAGFSIASGWLTPTRNIHTPAMLDDDDVILILTPEGCGTLKQLGREVTIADGAATFTSNGAPGEFLGNVKSRLWNARFKRSMLAPFVIDIEGALIRPIHRDDPALRLMRAYAGVFTDAQAMATPELRRAVSLHMHDLAVLALGANRQGAAAAKSRGVRAARLQAIKEYIVQNLSRRDLSAETVAAQQGISPRYVNMLFEQEGVSLSEFVLANRLLEAHRALVDPRLAARPISAIAFDIGFGDLSYFNRTFRRRFGATPSDVRAKAMMGEPGA